MFQTWFLIFFRNFLKKPNPGIWYHKNFHPKDSSTKNFHLEKKITKLYHHKTTSLLSPLHNIRLKNGMWTVLGPFLINGPHTGWGFHLFPLLGGNMGDISLLSKNQLLQVLYHPWWERKYASKNYGSFRYIGWYRANNVCSSSLSRTLQIFLAHSGFLAIFAHFGRFPDEFSTFGIKVSGNLQRFPCFVLTQKFSWIFVKFLCAFLVSSNPRTRESRDE